MTGSAAVLIIKLTLVLLLAALLSWHWRNRRASLRHTAWLCALVSLLALPALMSVGPSWNVVPVGNILTDLACSASNRSCRAADLSGPTVQPAGKEAGGQDHSVTHSSDPKVALHALSTVRSIAAAKLPTVLLLLWAIGAFALTVLALHGAFDASQLVKRAHALDAQSRPVVTATEIAARLGLKGPIRIGETKSITYPIAAGVLRPTVLLPSAWRSWPVSRLRAVLVHELAHLRRRDPVTHFMAHLTVALYWPHPGVWHAVRRLKLEAEYACDETVVSMGVQPAAYAQHLFAIASAARQSRGPRWSIAMAGPGSLERRVGALLRTGIGPIAEDPSESGAGLVQRRQHILPVFALGVLVACLAAVGPAPATPQGFYNPADEVHATNWPPYPRWTSIRSQASSGFGPLEAAVADVGRMARAGSELPAIVDWPGPQSSVSSPLAPPPPYPGRDASTRGVPGLAVVLANERRSFASLARSALAEVLSERATQDDSAVLDSVVHELWFTLSMGVHWPAADSVGMPTLAIEGDAQMNIRLAEVSAPIIEVGTTGGSFRSVLPAIVKRLGSRSGEALDPAQVRRLAQAGDRLEQSWIRHVTANSRSSRMFNP